ncbi:MAG: transcription-repair coupling factor [Pseudomonadota bacterium]|nr:transcription-repair coupling factor [Pseudomonadota bacterium]
MTKIENKSPTIGKFLFSGVPEGYDARLLSAGGIFGLAQPHLHIARDAGRMSAMAQAIAFFSPDLTVLEFPAWDCLPYDRVSPNRETVSSRIDTLTRLSKLKSEVSSPLLVLTTANAVVQRVPSSKVLAEASRHFSVGSTIDADTLSDFFAQNGFERAGTVREPGEYAIRGGILDIYPPGDPSPLRADLLGDELETLRTFDPVTQRSLGTLQEFSLKPASEVLLNEDAIARFRTGYRDAFGAVGNDTLYVSISEGRKQIGMEHWLPLFQETLETLFDYMPTASVSLDHDIEQVLDQRIDMIADYYDARLTFLKNTKTDTSGTQSVYRPLPPGRLYLEHKDLEQMLAERTVAQFSPFAAPDGVASGTYKEIVQSGARRVPDFAAARVRTGKSGARDDEGPDDVFGALKVRLQNEIERGKRTVITAFTTGSRERLSQLLRDHEVGNLTEAETWPESDRLSDNETAVTVLPIENGFVSDDIFLVTEQDILGERIIRTEKKRRRAEDFIADVSEIATGDLVVHVDHGIGRYDGLETLDVAGAPHDCLRLIYGGDDRLYVPVENVEVLSRFGSGDMPATLDKLGGAAWQARKSRMKERLRDIADQLIKVAADRSLKTASKIDPPQSLYQEFAARFPYTETDDQVHAIEDTLADLQSGTAMDRLICGDVGFGKTEVALRAAFATVMSGGQVAVVVPTTLLCRQHFATFRERFTNAPVRIEQLSRLVTGKTADNVRDGVKNGEVEIVVGTHALLSKSISFNKLELLIVDEEQHFGVTHKERLKTLKADVHVLTLTATPIPRTLQMALSGVKDMSLIGTPPVDRLAVRTFVMPFDEVMIREAIMREHFRGGQIFYVCPRIADLDEIAATLRDLVPEIKIAVAHGQMGTRPLEDVMTSFYDGSIDLLLSTQIVESGLDIPTANTMIIHRADMFGLAQLYQLRGRIGRSKLRAYCYLTLPNNRKLTDAANKRLEVMQSLDTLGAGFTLASHDLDIRGAGNLLGEEQSGHIREVGVELYQHMLEEAVAAARGVDNDSDRDWSPLINIGIPVLIPERYVSDLGVRLGLYRRIAALNSSEESEAFAAELIDRFGPLPEEAENLLQVVTVKRNCRMAGIEKLDAGPKGATLSFRNNRFANPQGLISMVTEDVGRTKLRPDHTIVVRREWSRPSERLKGVRKLATRLAKIAVEENATAEANS